jgi:hypothetical protein
MKCKHKNQKGLFCKKCGKQIGTIAFDAKVGIAYKR